MSRHSREQQQQQQQTFLMLLGVHAAITSEEASHDRQSKAPVTPLLDAKKAQEKFNNNRAKHDYRNSPKPGKSKHNYR